ncbi:MAG: ABC transporter permease [Xanthomonadales bacterium]|nr:ABC transporter permease [Xanthomonadales bacterium]
MISLAGRDIAHAWGRFLFTGLGLGLLLGVTLTMAGVYRGMVDDAQALLDGSGADLWVVQKDTLGPWAEPSALPDDLRASLSSLPGVQAAANAIYLTLQVRHGQRDLRVMLVGIELQQALLPGQPPQLIAGRLPTARRFEAVVDIASDLNLGDTVWLRRQPLTIVGLTRRMVSSGGDPMLFVNLPDAQEAQYRRDPEAVRAQRARTDRLPALAGVNEDVRSAIDALQQSTGSVNTVLIRLSPGADAQAVTRAIREGLALGVHDREAMQDILIAKLIATSARQIAMFLVILAIVSAAIVAFIIYTLTLGKLREIAVLKLIGTRNRTIALMILQQALALGLIGFAFGRISAHLWAPYFPKFVLLIPEDSLRALALTLVVCALASALAIRAALTVDPAEAIGG